MDLKLESCIRIVWDILICIPGPTSVLEKISPGSLMQGPMSSPAVCKPPPRRAPCRPLTSVGRSRSSREICSDPHASFAYFCTLYMRLPYKSNISRTLSWCATSQKVPKISEWVGTKYYFNLRIAFAVKGTLAPFSDILYSYYMATYLPT